MPKRAVVLLSGGLDSATCAAVARDEGYTVHALSIRYGQRHSAELDAAAAVAAHLGVDDHRIVDIGLGSLGGSALTDSALEVPKNAVGAAGVPITYVPARNTVFLALALGHAEVVGAEDIYFGANALDYSGYPDCRPAFREAFEALANVATKAVDDPSLSYRIRAPLMDLTKAEIIRLGSRLGVDYGLTHSCYDPSGAAACGACDSCLLRKKGFEEAGVTDPTRYV